MTPLITVKLEMSKKIRGDEPALGVAPKARKTKASKAASAFDEMKFENLKRKFPVKISIHLKNPWWWRESA